MNCNKIQKFNASSIMLLCFLITSCNIHTEKIDQANEKGIKHGIVYYGDGRYAAWPANNGLWSWGNEILVGFSEGKYDEKTPGLHPLDRASASGKFARSRDGGITWTIEDAFKRGQATMETADNKADSVTILTENIDDFTNPDFILTFRSSHFYYSNNRGKTWMGPFELPNLGTAGYNARTDYVVDGKQQLGAFLTVDKSNGREGRVLYARTDDGALHWELVSWIGPEHEGFDIIPSSVRLSPTELITTIRVRTVYGLDKITAYTSSDNGKT
jgi:hypothetical protein